MPKKNGADTAGVGHNSRTLPEQGKDYVRRIENVLDQLASERGSYMATCKSLREDINHICDEAKGVGITKKTLKAIVKARELAKKADEARSALDMAEQDSFDNIRLALGDLAELPLGKAALGETEQPSTAG